MSQLHKRFTDEQIKVLVQDYYQRKMKRAEIQDLLEIGKTRFFALLKEYRHYLNHHHLSILMRRLLFQQ